MLVHYIPFPSIFPTCVQYCHLPKAGSEWRMARYCTAPYLDSYYTILRYLLVQYIVVSPPPTPTHPPPVSVPACALQVYVYVRFDAHIYCVYRMYSVWI